MVYWLPPCKPKDCQGLLTFEHLHYLAQYLQHIWHGVWILPYGNRLSRQEGDSINNQSWLVWVGQYLNWVWPVQRTWHFLEAHTVGVTRVDLEWRYCLSTRCERSRVPFEDHLNNRSEVPGHLKKYNLKLKPKKCFLCHIECEFLGKNISCTGVSISPANLDAVQTWFVLTDKKEVESFLIYGNCHRVHVQGYAELS